MKRYHVTLGAKTTAGGTVVSASSNSAINGKKMALENDRIVCPACKSDGVIVCVEPRIPETSDGLKVALHDDLCRCKCPAPPRLIANQTLRSQALGGDDSADASALAAILDSLLPASADIDDALPIRLLDLELRTPLSRQTYRLEFPGKVIEGTTDADGYTEAIRAADRKHLIAWHVAGDAASG